MDPNDADQNVVGRRADEPLDDPDVDYPDVDEPLDDPDVDYPDVDDPDVDNPNPDMEGGGGSVYRWNAVERKQVTANDFANFAYTRQHPHPS